MALAFGALHSWRAGAPGFTWDESVTVIASRMPPPDLAKMCFGYHDAVHFFYYAFIRLWAGAFGRGEMALRAPSALAVAVAVYFTVLIGRRLKNTAVGVGAGLALGFLPAVAAHALDARPFALAMAAAAGWTWALVRPARRWWVYTLWGLGAVSLSFYTAMLLVPHALWLVAGGLAGGLAAGDPARPVERRRFGRAAAPVAGVAVALAGLALGQRSQVRWLAKFGVNVEDQLVSPYFAADGRSALIAWGSIVVGLLVIAVRAIARRGRAAPAPGAAQDRAGGAAEGHTGGRLRGLRLRLRLPGPLLVAGWLVLPQTAVVLAHTLVTPSFAPRYLLFAAPALALALAWTARSALANAGLALVTAAMVASGLTGWLALRDGAGAGAAFNGDEYGPVARHLADAAAPGDTILFTGEGWNGPAKGAAAYRDLYRPFTDATLLATAEAIGRFEDARRTVGEALDADRPDRLWFVYWPDRPGLAAEQEALRLADLCPSSTWSAGRTRIDQYTACRPDRGPVP